ncbi:alpha/beta hydrolase family protein [Pseudoduganella namucuonensis]|uniref:Prolyl oligopeptidase family protein n=1 Tax=Pseudoduganella namucuonensis TaxID=1035707 RepID=A0A1I7KJU4_9BURK|nr:prolyl oligopeptidase family serine peptidase [Pseudoduganella namucuonensis]SFU97715.1 Prolyl oligopeptidase family protein [Pseudoduganella namucuonensis]
MHRFLSRWAALVCALGLAPLAGAAEAPPAGHFFGNPGFTKPRLSPSGTHLAVLASDEAHRQRLIVVDLNDFSLKAAAEFRDGDVGAFSWLSDERLLFTSADSQAAQGDQRYAPGLFAANRDGTAFRQLASSRGKPFITVGGPSSLLPWHTFMLDQDGAQDGPEVYVANHLVENLSADREQELLLLNTKTGKAKPFDAPSGMRWWMLDQQGQPRLAVSRRDGQTMMHYRDPASGAWREIARHASYTGAGQGFQPLAFGPDGTLYVASSEKTGYAAVHTYDIAAGKLGERPLLNVQGYDFMGHLVFGGGKLLGARFLADGEGTEWFDAGMKAVQAEIDQRLPRTVNLVTPPVRAQTPWVLVTSYSDRQPQVHLVYNTRTRDLKRIGDSHAAIKPAQMAAQDVVRYKARDGLEIPALLTLPAGKDKNLPLVVLVHGGPYVRGTRWGWEAEAQFLASRGYAVLQPEFRGSAGYGGAHLRAGWKQWGLAMQDDIADGAKWAAAQGYAAPRRVCVAGASYGGYATLMGLVNDPELFRCGVAWAGVTDLELLYKGHWRFDSDMSADFKQYGMRDLIGDPERDAERFAATSPLRQAARVTRPLLLAHGGADLRVPLVHGTRFRDAVKATNKDVEWVEYEQEGHGWYLPRNRIDFWTRVEAFLNRHIGPQP